MKTAREVAHAHVGRFATWDGRWCHANRMELAAPAHSNECNALTAAIEQDRREIVEACAVRVESMSAVLPAFCAKTAANAIRSLPPKETT